MRKLVPRGIEIAGPAALTAVAEDYSAILAEVGDHASAARLLGTADSMRERLGYPRHFMQAAEIAGPIARAREALSEEAWAAAYREGRVSTLEDALRAAIEASAERSRARQ
jgi:hypothetical protein